MPNDTSVAEVETKHTPGPWRVSDCSLGHKALIEHGDENTFSPIIGSVYSDDGRLPIDANARLIAAAPELLEASKHWFAVHNRAMSGREAAEEAFASGLVTRAALRLQAAIAKAEGRAL